MHKGGIHLFVILKRPDKNPRTHENFYLVLGCIERVGGVCEMWVLGSHWPGGLVTLVIEKNKNI